MVPQINRAQYRKIGSAVELKTIDTTMRIACTAIDSFAAAPKPETF